MADPATKSVHLYTLAITLILPVPFLESLPPAGRLSHCYSNWKQITSDNWVLQSVQGYHLELVRQPIQKVPPPELHLSEIAQQHIEAEVEKLIQKEAVLAVSAMPNQFISSIFAVPKKDGSQRPVVNLKPLNTFVKKIHFKMEGVHMIKELLRKDDWMVSIDLKDAYLSVPVTPTHCKYLRFNWRGQIFGLSSAPRMFTKVLRPVMAILRQRGMRSIIFIDNVLLIAQSPQELLDQTREVIQLLQLLGFRINWEKSDSMSGDNLPRLPDKLKVDDDLPSRGETTGHHRGLQDGPIPRVSVCTYSGQNYRQDDSGSSGNCHSTIALQEVTVCKEQSIPVHSVIRVDHKAGYGSQSRVTMVDQQNRELEWKQYTTTDTGYGNRNRCFPTGLGSVDGQYDNRGAMVTGQEIATYQCTGIERRCLCSESICERIEKHPRKAKNGQYNSNCLPQPHGGNEIPKLSTMCIAIVAMVFAEGYNHLSRTSAGSEEHQSRCGIPNSSLIGRVDAASNALSVDNAGHGAMSSGFVCYTPQQSIAALHQLEARPLCSGHGCLSDSMAIPECICIPSLLPGGEVPTENQDREKLNSSNSASVANSILVPSVAGIPGGYSNAIAAGSESPQRPLQSEASNDGAGYPAACRLESVRKQHLAKGISEKATELITASWSSGTNTAYQSAWRKWDCWCAQRQIDPFSCDIRFFLNFLAELFDQGLQHRSISAIRSAVSMTHNQVEGIPIGQHPMVTRLLKGVHNSRPPQPRYTQTWDVDVVIKYICSMGDNKELSLKTLSLKLAILMALVDASRTSELAALDIRYRRFKPEGVYFTLATLTKKTTPGKTPKEVFFGAYPPNRQLCVVQCLKHYEQRTKAFRGSGEQQLTKLFLSYIKPHKPVTSQRIAHWIKMFLKDAGIDTGIFSAHSVRGASATAAMDKGVTLTDILHVADWSSDTTFRRFYYRPMKDATYAHKVLSPKSDLVRGIMRAQYLYVWKGLGTLKVLALCLYWIFAAVGFEFYQCHMQRISRSIIANLTRARRARS